MSLHHIKQGLDLPLKGSPDQAIADEPALTRVALLASDYVGMKPRMDVLEGDTVLRGQPLFSDRKRGVLAEQEEAAS